MNAPGAVVSCDGRCQINDRRWRKPTERALVIVASQSDLFEMIIALHSPRCFPSRLDGGKQQSDKDANDGNNNKQFNQSEGVSISIHFVFVMCVLIHDAQLWADAGHSLGQRTPLQTACQAVQIVKNSTFRPLIRKGALHPGGTLRFVGGKCVTWESNTTYRLKSHLTQKRQFPFRMIIESWAIAAP